MMAKMAQTGRPGIASAAVPSPKMSASPVIAARGGSRSDADSSAAAPMTCASEDPNMLSAASNGERVAA